MPERKAVEDIVVRLRARQSMRTWNGTGDAPKQAIFADTLCHEAATEIENLRKQLDSAIGDADRAIETARRVDGREREALRSALAELVRVYVTEGAAITPAAEIGNAWKKARAALNRG